MLEQCDFMELTKEVLQQCKGFTCKDEAMKKRKIGKFGKIQQKVNKKFGNVEIKAYFCALNKCITLKIRRLWQ